MKVEKSSFTPCLRFDGFIGKWKSGKLNSIAKVIDCKHRTPPYEESGIPVISPGTIAWGALDLRKPSKRVAESEYESMMDHCTPNIGDLVFSRNQSLGVASIVTSEQQFVLGQDTVLIKSNCRNLFLYFLLQSYKTQSQIRRLSGGSTFSRINLSDLRSLTFCFPESEEQKKIASFLSTVDLKITKLREKRELLETYKRGMMQKLFSQELRFKSDDGSEFPEWNRIKFSEIGNIVGGGTPDSYVTDYWDGYINWFTPSEIKSKYVKNSLRKITSDGLSRSSAKLLEAGTLLLCTRATVGEVAIALEKCSTNQGFQSICVNEENNNEYWYYWLKSNKKMLITRSSGSTFLEIGKSELAKMPVESPMLKEQQKIADCLSAIDKKMDAVAQQIAQMETFKQGLLQKMFV
jgi:type I restriction enzyme S subunit